MSELLHWVTDVTKSPELVVKVPLPPGQGSREHCRLTVVDEDTTPPLIVLVMVTEQVSPVVAPAGPGPIPLHWSIDRVAA